MAALIQFINRRMNNTSKHEILSMSKVAWVTPILGVDGRLLYFDALLRGFAERCGEFRVFTSEFRGDAGALPFGIVKFGSLKRLYKVGRHTKAPDSKYIHGLNFSVVVPSGFRALTQWEPGLIVINEFSLTSLYALIARRLLRRTRALMLVECRPRAGGSAIFSWFRLRYRRYLARQADVLLTNNNIGRDYLINDLRVNPDDVVVRPYLVSDMTKSGSDDANKIEPKKMPIGDRIIFLYVGQLFSQKGVALALRAFTELPEKYRSKYLFHIVGDGPNRLALQEYVSENRLDDNVIFFGRQPYERLNQYYDEAHVFLFPTTNDYRALVPFEAISRGMPVLGSIHDGGIEETVHVGENGFSFDPFDTGQLCSLLMSFMDNPGLIPQFSLHSLEMSRSYTLQNAIDALMLSAGRALMAK